ncbi:hypothetical protein [uncultured Maribacter sp.]|uniref:phage baseplate protein n=1 Tax=uncultured Maribacter sp. TaxID=431308 RepID=UPI0030D9C19E|tara:strand:- start:1791 stop:2531 length:741 start_codon:yes stop_codon:yes gene_type:complete
MKKRKIILLITLVLIKFQLNAQVVNKNGQQVLENVQNTTDLNKPISTATQTVINLKANLASPTFTGTPTAPTATLATNSTQIATTEYVDLSVSTAFSNTGIQAVYPVGSIYISTISSNPSTSLGFGTWVAFGQGRVLVGSGNGFTGGSTGGSADAVIVSHGHAFTGNELAPHNHQMYRSNSGYSGGGADAPIADPSTGNTSNSLVTTASVAKSAGTPSGTLSTEGVSGTNANLQPYIVIYMWNRTN